MKGEKPVLRNVVIVCDFADVCGGSIAVAVDTAVLLAEKGLSVYFFAGTGEPDGRLTSNPNIKIIMTGQKDILHDTNRIRAMCNGIYNFKAKRMFADLLSALDRNETVINVHQWMKVMSCSVLSQAQEMGFKTFVTLHDYGTVCPVGAFYNFPAQKVCEIPPMSLKCILSNCDSRHYYHKVWRVIRAFVQNRVMRKNPKLGYIFISGFSKCQMLRRVPEPRNSFMIHNPVHYGERFRVKAENNSIFAAIGRVSPEKGIENFCKAVRSSGTEGVVIGDGPLLAGLRAEYPEITFTGWQNDSQIREWFRKIRCIVFPSAIYEVSPLVPLEANAYGIPVISFSQCAASENASFTCDSQEGLEDIMRKVSSEDIKALSEKIYDSFDESITEQYPDNLIRIYESQLV